MSEDLREQCEELIERAWEAGYNDTGFAFAQEAVRLADLLNDRDLQWDARRELVDVASFSGHPREGLVAFSWMLAASDSDPGWRPDRELMWSYKWIAANLPDYPEFSRAQIEGVLDDMERRYRANGLSLKAVYSERFGVAWALGDEDAWQRYYRLWLEAPKDGSEDCRACERNELVTHAIRTGDLRGAFELAAPILENRMRCSSVPHRTLANLLRPAREMGDPEQADKLAQRLSRLIARDVTHCGTYGDLLQHYAASGNITGGLRQFEKTLPWLKGHTSPAEEFDYWLGACNLLAAACEVSRKPTRKLRLPKEFPGWRPDGVYELSQVLATAEQRRDELARAFDARNGNDRVSRRIRQSRA
ncbi:MAG: hypothetical protein M5U25_20495 [Planctomycetota bacterium]|nr:hypothetical protein [Planctomycetota bacterium]